MNALLERFCRCLIGWPIIIAFGNVAPPSPRPGGKVSNMLEFCWIGGVSQEACVRSRVLGSLWGCLIFFHDLWQVGMSLSKPQLGLQGRRDEPCSYLQDNPSHLFVTVTCRWVKLYLSPLVCNSLDPRRVLRHPGAFTSLFSG